METGVQFKLPDIFTKEQKFWGFLGTLGVFAVGGTALYKALPWLTELFTRATDMFGALLAFIGLAVTTIIVLFVLSQKQTWAIGRTLFNVFARMAAKTIAQALPQEVSQSYVSDHVQPKLQSAVAAKSAANGELEMAIAEEEKNNKQIAEFERMIEELVHRSCPNDVWASSEDEMLFNSLAQQLAFCKETAPAISSHRELLEGWRDVLKELEQFLKNELQTMKFFTQKLISQYEAAKRTAKLARQVGDVIGGDSMKEMYEMSMDFMRRRIHQSMGEVESVMSMVKDVTAVRKLKDASASRELLQRIREKKQHTAQLAAQSAIEGQAIATAKPEQVGSLLRQAGAQSSSGQARNRRLLGN
ncbi:MAG: hypothetical protein G01um101420_426 [Parcubacteria group bacterium Gr01-1014_20]|nr:MAG: hypothetical protein G01um101420_426 [Parcubacteria group bacterium Gr01-1014_20]